jgi:transcriptional regulator with XRE-family HTH domain
MKLDLRRQTLGMSRATLAKRSGVSVPTVHRILSGKEDAPTVTSVEAIANALGMKITLTEVVGADELRERQARKKAQQAAAMIQGTMGLEAQAIDQKSLESLARRNMNRLLSASGRKLWDE